MKESIKLILNAEKESLNNLGEKVTNACKTKKQLKKEAILNSALDLFTEKGINNTSIDDIVKLAGIAKGTFYLYFQDKYAVADQLVLDLSANIISKIMAYLDDYIESHPKVTFEEKVLFFVDSLIDVLLNTKEILPIVHRKIPKGLFVKASQMSKSFSGTLERFVKEFEEAGGDAKTAEIRVYMILELANSVVYNAVIDEVPYELSEIKPQLYEMIKRIIKP